MLAQYFRYAHTFSLYVKPTARRDVAPSPPKPWFPPASPHMLLLPVWPRSPLKTVLLRAMWPAEPGDQESRPSLRGRASWHCAHRLMRHVSSSITRGFAFSLTNQFQNVTLSGQNINDNMIVLTCFTNRDPSFSGSSRHFSNSPKKKLKQEENY